MNNTLHRLIGKKIKRIFYNELYLKFITDDGNFIYTVEGDCCSHSYFYDFIGVKKLLNNGVVKSVNSVKLYPDDAVEAEYGLKDNKNCDEAIKVYGYEIVTEDPIFGDVTSVLSFRNYSNGYYGGWMDEITNDHEVNPEIFDDVLETEWAFKNKLNMIL